MGKKIQEKCSKHDDPLKVYCETCCEVICACCTISEEHNKHNFELISECYEKHHHQIQSELHLLKQRVLDVSSVFRPLVAREQEVVQQGEHIKEQIHTHAQHLVDQIQKSERHLLEHVDSLVQRKIHILTQQREQAERVHDKLKVCEKLVETTLQEWNQQQLLAEKSKILQQMKEAYSCIEPSSLQPFEEPDVKFTKVFIAKDIGEIKSNTFGSAVLNSLSCVTNKKSTATLVLRSHDRVRLSLSISFVSCKLFSPDNQLIQCEIDQVQQGEYIISFTPFTSGEHQLIVQVGGVDIPGSPFTLPVLPLQELRGKKARSIARPYEPYGIAVCDNGNIIVVESEAHRVTILDKEGNEMKSFGSKGTKRGQFRFPKGVALSNDKHILVSDEHRLQKLTFDGICVKSVGRDEKGNGQLQFYLPQGIAVHPTTGYILVCDSMNNRIQVFDNDLVFLHTITPGIFKSFKKPYDVTFDSENCIYVAEWDNQCITKLNTTGQYITRFSGKGSTIGQLCCPVSLAINNNLVYICEWENARISVFDTKGSFIRCFRGTEKLYSPRNIRVDSLSNVYISDSGNCRIVIV